MGYFDKLEDDSLATRLSAYVNYRLQGGKDDIKTFWPLKSDEQVTGGAWSSTPKEMVEKILKAHGIKLNHDGIRDKGNG